MLAFVMHRGDGHPMVVTACTLPFDPIAVRSSKYVQSARVEVEDFELTETNSTGAQRHTQCRRCDQVKEPTMVHKLRPRMSTAELSEV